jgi:hypothetical protein
MKYETEGFVDDVGGGGGGYGKKSGGDYEDAGNYIRAYIGDFSYATLDKIFSFQIIESENGSVMKQGGKNLSRRGGFLPWTSDENVPELQIFKKKTLMKLINSEDYVPEIANCLFWAIYQQVDEVT